MSDSERYAQLSHLEMKIEYAFTNPQLLDLALTHRSTGGEHNERLEYLGDSILGMIIAKCLYFKFPYCPEGDLTRMRSTLVRETTLAQIAREFSLGSYLKLGLGERKSGGASRDSILADAVESIIGAMFLDSKEDIRIVEKVVYKWFKSRLNEINPKVNQKDAKSTLQELLQSKKYKLPSYKVDRIEGQDNEQTFYVSVYIEHINKSFKGVGKTRRKAEQIAAQEAINYLTK